MMLLLHVVKMLLQCAQKVDALRLRKWILMPLCEGSVGGSDGGSGIMAFDKQWIVTGSRAAVLILNFCRSSSDVTQVG
jgi:hypothetical protein